MAPALRLLALVCTASALVVRDGGELKAALANGAPAIELELQVHRGRRRFRGLLVGRGRRSDSRRGIGGTSQKLYIGRVVGPRVWRGRDEIPRVVVVRGLN